MSEIENLTIMFTDIVEYSKQVSELSRKESAWLLNKHNRILPKVIKRFGGTIIKSLGDAFLVTFRSPTDSILCAMAIQDCIWEFNQNDNKLDVSLELRVAINTGEVRLSGSDIFGEAVNIAARLEAFTPANKIYLTESVFLSMHKREVKITPVGEQNFKGVDYPIMVYEVEPETKGPEPFGGAHIHRQPAGRSKFTVGKLFVGLCATVVTAFFTWWLTLNYMPPASSIGIDKLNVEYTSAKKSNPANIEEAITALDELSYAQSQDYIKEKNYLLLKKFVEDNLEVYPQDAYLNMLQGHVLYYYKDYPAAIKFYKVALEAKPQFANDALLSKNLIRLIDLQRVEANQLVGKYLSNSMIQGLRKRTGQPGLRGRYDAFYLLKDSGNIDKVDKVALNIWDLKELESCKLKKVAVTELKRLNDPRALDVLKEIKRTPFLKQFKYLCLTSIVNSTIAQLEGKPEPKQQDDSQAPAATNKKEQAEEKKEKAKETSAPNKINLEAIKINPSSSIAD